MLAEAVEDVSLPVNAIPDSLWDIMKYFNAALLVNLSRILETAATKTQLPTIPFLGSHFAGSETEVLSATLASSALGVLIPFEGDCANLELIASVATIQKLISLVKQGCTFQQFGHLAEELQDRLIDEMKGRHFWSLSLREARLIEEPFDGWREVLDRFPAAVTDVEEVGKCLAFARYGQCVSLTDGGRARPGGIRETSRRDRSQGRMGCKL
jgi:hypothetical protein